jgi:guanylate kinase
MALASSSLPAPLSETTQPGELFILSAPSGAGKTTLIQNLATASATVGSDVAFSVSHTTRKPRPGEIEGRDYHFVDQARFQEMIAADAFLEWARVHDSYYGTSLQEVVPRLDQGIDVLLDIDVQGAEQVLTRYPRAHSIFIMPPSYEDLERRLYRRGLDDEQAIARRLAVSLREMECYDRYHYVIVNDDARRASEALAAIILDKRYLRHRMQARVREILRDFEDRGSIPPT